MNRRRIRVIITILFMITACGFIGYLAWNQWAAQPSKEKQPAAIPDTTYDQAEEKEPKNKESHDQLLVEENPYVKKNISDRAPTDYVDIRDVDTNIIVRPVFLEKALWVGKGSAAKLRIVQTYKNAVLRKATADKLSNANMLAMSELGCRIRIYEAYRSADVQAALREHFVNTAPKELQSMVSNYVASPGYSKHQLGVAVDLTLVDMETGRELSMPSDYLSFSPDAYAFPKISEKNEDTIENVKNLQNIMTAAGFEIYSQEWWHFNDNETAEKVKYQMINPDDY